jgi:Transposase DDE domain
VTGDTKYGTIANIKALEDAGIRAYVPLPDWEHMTPFYGPSKFSYDAQHDQYLCPQGQPLLPFRTEYQAKKVEYRADAAACNACPLKARCTASNNGRQVHRSFHASYLERVKGYHQTRAYQKAMNKRKVWVEPLFAEAKDWHGLRRFRLRRLWRVNCEAQVIAAGQNLKRLLKKRGWGRRPFPTEALSASFLLCYAFCSSMGRESLTNACPMASTNPFFQRESWFFRRPAQLSPQANAIYPLLKLSLSGTFSTGWVI